MLLTVVKDTLKPVTTAPVEIFLNQTTGTSSVKVRLGWSGVDTGGTGIASYKLQVSVNGGSYSTISLSSATATGVDADARRQLDLSVPGARDGQGRQRRLLRHRPDLQGGPGPEQQFGPRLRRAMDDDVELERAWREPPVHERGWSLGDLHRLDAATIGFIATRTTTSGSAQVWVDGTLAATINLRSSSTGYRKLVFHRHFAAGGTHTVEIRSLGGGRVYLDAFAVLR